MIRSAQRISLTALIAVAAGLMLSASGVAFAQAGGPGARGGMPEDWSHRHLLYPNPDTRDEAARKGTLAFEHWKEKNKDPRYAAQVARKTRFVTARDGKPFSPKELRWAARFDRNPPAATPVIKRDWSTALGTGGYGKPGVFPAKFSFYIDAAPSCANDFVVFPTTGTGATASQTGRFTNSPTAGQTVTITNPNTGQSITLTASSSSNTGLNFLRGNASTSATNLAAAIVRNGAIVGVTESGATRPNVTVTALDPGAGANSITLAETLSNFSWTGGNLAGGSDPPTTRPTIVAFNNLYDTTCPGTSNTTPPPPMWAYNTGAAYTETSPVLSFDDNGAQVAFVQRGGASGTASLVLLKWSSGSGNGTVAAPVTPASTSSATYRTCTAPCMLVIPFGNSAPDTNSSPYVDYAGDVLYVGDDLGVLHKFTGVFNGTPAEVATAPWPVAVSAGNALTSPVYDSASGLVFVGSASGTATGGSLHSINASGAVVTSSRLAMNSSTGIVDAPIVDANASRVYAFVSSNGTTGTNCSATPCLSVYQFTATFASNNAGNSNVKVGRGTTSAASGILYAGNFDDAYYTSATQASPTGHLYVCGHQGGTALRPTLWQIPVTNNAMGAAVQGPRLTGNTNADCSAVTEISDGTNDYLYASVTAGGNDTGCSGACVYMFGNVLSGTRWGGGSVAWGTSVVANAGLAAPGGTSGIIVDNISTATGASQIYYSTLTSPGNAVQASQAALN